MVIRFKICGFLKYYVGRYPEGWEPLIPGGGGRALFRLLMPAVAGRRFSVTAPELLRETGGVRKSQLPGDL